MNVIVELSYTNGFFKPDFTDKKTGEITQGDFVVQGQQKLELSNGEVKFINIDIPMDRSLAKNYSDKKMGDLVKIPCSIYGENFAQIKIGKAK
jgi:predicted DNA-binding antitoxin AbrB/MazE fold protein